VIFVQSVHGVWPVFKRQNRGISNSCSFNWQSE
jgi:hypothetical protein